MKKPSNIKPAKNVKDNRLLIYGQTVGWFGVGVVLGFFFLVTFAFIFLEKLDSNVVFPGVMVNGINFGGQSQSQIRDYFLSKNHQIEESQFTFNIEDNIATVSAKDLDAGYEANLLSKQAYSIGRSPYLLSNIIEVFQAYLQGINLSPAYSFSQEKLERTLDPIKKNVEIEPVNAVFQFENGRVTTFQPSLSGKKIDINSISQTLLLRISTLMTIGRSTNFEIKTPTLILLPKVKTSDANNLGIKELIGTGTSLFQHSIPNRVFNVTLAASRLNGVLVAPDEEFSFGKALGDVSSYTGYLQAYVIQNGKTVLGDGGGVCQVSTTFFRALLNAGLPITERHAHAYRVGYYEEDSPPGIDATVYVPTVDLKFKNDTGHYILIQTVVDPSILRLTFYLYGTSDGRISQVTDSVIKSETPAPPPLYQDDPTLAKGETRQVDFSANGANVSFSRTVTRDGKVIISDTYTSNYQPWQAVYMVGTK